MINNVVIKKTNRGFTLLVAVVTASIVLAMGMSILNITLKEFMLATIARDSEMAFYAADAGMECALYWDESDEGETSGIFEFSGPGGQISCMEQNPTIGTITPGNQETFEVSWGTAPTAVCAVVSIIKDNNVSSSTCSSVCTTVRSSGYNRSCPVMSSGADPRTVERRLRTQY